MTPPSWQHQSASYAFMKHVFATQPHNPGLAGWFAQYYLAQYREARRNA